MAFETKLEKKADKVVRLGDDGEPNQIEGYYLGSNDTQGDYGLSRLHIFKTPDGNVGVWGKTNSNRLLTQDLVGTCCRLSYTGKGPKTKGRNPAYLYKLEFDKENTIDASTIAESTIETDDGGEDNDATGYPDTAATSYRSPAPASTTRPTAPSAEDQAKVRAAMASARVTR